MEILQSKELRIGNYVNSNVNGISKIEQAGSSLNKDYIGSVSLHGHHWTNSCFPIPITVSWLIKFGFEKEADGDSYDYFLEIGANCFYCYWSTDGSLDHIYLEGFDVEIKHVHQLQNLYFALTGEELTL